MNDLMDNINESSPVIDNVSGYTNAQFYNALRSDVKSMIQYRDKLLLQTGFNQQIQVNQLFAEYGY